MASGYPPDFYEELAESSRSAAQEVVPLILDLLGVRSVVDVGCGTGAWLAAFRERGLEDVTGVDTGDVPLDGLQIPRERFRQADLAGPLRLPRTFDLAISLEVAEHLPTESADGFVESLVRLAPLVVFSAAVPLQGGFRHLNEQWPEYWAEKFARWGYLPYDVIRPHVWNNPRVAWWYSQNILLYAQPSGLPEALQTGGRPAGMLNVVHPQNYALLPARLAGPAPGGIQRLARRLIRRARAVLERRR
jgi:SAM-dependent methyltransferase